jgi:hypothetical protein
VTVCSKVADSPWVAQLMMSIDNMRDDWKTSIELRKPKGKESNHVSFTTQKITNLNFAPNEEVTTAIIKQLAHIYHYYTKDPYE